MNTKENNDKVLMEIANKIKEHGGNLYLVGGAVRDEIIGTEVHDRDYCVTGISKDEFQCFFPDCNVRGKSFEVFDMYGCEFAMARTEAKCGKGHKSFEVKTGKDITIEDDLRRRDLTINSIAKDVLTGKLIDPYGGMDDIRNGIIRATSPAFCEDPLRAYRAARLACRLGFYVDKSTIKQINRMKSELIELSVERVYEELKKALSCKKPSVFFEVLKEADVLDVHFKEINRLIGVEQPAAYHPEGDAFNHTMLALDKCAADTDDIRIRFAVLVHDLGKGKTPVEEYPHHINHDVNGVEEVSNLCNRLKLPNDWCSYGKVAAKEHMRAGIFYKMTNKKQVDFIERIYKTKIGLKGMEIVVEADRNCRGVHTDKVLFAELGEKLMKSVNGNEVKAKYRLEDGEQLKQKLHQLRIETWGRTQSFKSKLRDGLNHSSRNLGTDSIIQVETWGQVNETSQKNHKISIERKQILNRILLCKGGINL